jgi:hypothetical protein
MRDNKMLCVHWLIVGLLSGTIGVSLIRTSTRERKWGDDIIFVDDCFFETIIFVDDCFFKTIISNCRAYKHGWDRYHKRTRWIIHMDIDEYPVNPYRSNRGWLLQTVEDIALRYRDRFPNGVGTIHARNMGFIGWPDDSKTLLIDRLLNCTLTPVNDLTKPINFVAGTQVSLNVLFLLLF